MLENLPVLIPEDEIQKRIAEVAAEIDKDYNGEDVVIISILKGAVLLEICSVLKYPISATIRKFLLSTQKKSKEIIS